MRLAVIPARGASKRIPRKNIRLFCGQPIISWSIAAALNSSCFDRVIVSTDDPEISEVAKAHGAEVPFVRPLELSDDYTGTIPVIAHAIDWQNANGEVVSEACCIYATAPFIRVEDLQLGLQAIQESSVDYAFSVTNYASPIQRALKITPTKRVSMFLPEYFDIRSQDLEGAWHDAAQFYWGKADAWLTGVPIFSESAKPIILPRHRVQDIDTLDDWALAEIMFKCLNF